MFGSILVSLHLRRRRPDPILPGDNGPCATAMDLPSRAILVPAKWKESFYRQELKLFCYISHHLIGDSLLFYFFLFPPSPHWSLSFLSFYFFLFPSFFSFLSISLSLFPTLPTFLSVSSSFAFSIQPTFLSIPIFISFSHSAHLTYLSHSTLSRSLIISQSLQAAVD